MQSHRLDMLEQRVEMLERNKAGVIFMKCIELTLISLQQHTSKPKPTELSIRLETIL